MRMNAEREPGGPSRGRGAAGRALSVIAGACAIAAAIWSVSSLPLPSLDAAAPSVAVQAATSMQQQRVCPGGLAVPAGNASAPGAAGLTGVVTTAQAGDTENMSVTVLSASEIQAGRAVQPAVHKAPGRLDADGAPTRIAVTQLVSAADARAAGLAVTGCGQALADQWLLGGSTVTGSSSMLSLVNPTATASTVTIELFGPDGPVQAPGTSGIEVPPLSQRVLPLAGFAPEMKDLAMHVTSSGGTIAASLHRTDASGRTQLGTEIVPPIEAPSSELRFVSVPFTTTGQEPAAANAAAKGASARLLVPGDAPVRAELRVRDADGAELEPIHMTLQPGIVTEVPLSAYPVGRYTVTVTADRPVLGALRATNASGRIDAAWSVPAPALSGEQVVAIPEGPDPRLAIMNPGDAPVTLTVRGPDGQPGPVEIPPGASWHVRAQPGSYWIEGMDGQHAAVSYSGDGQMAMFAVTSGNPLAGSITAYR